jgi:hypothetical protein
MIPELDKIFEIDRTDKSKNVQSLNRIFDKIDYIGHQHKNKNDVFWLFRNGERLTISGITDIKGNYGFIRYQNTNESFTLNDSKAQILIKARFVGVLLNCNNAFSISQFVAYWLNSQAGFEVDSVNTNTLEVYEQETNLDTLNKEIEIFSIDFEFYASINNCDFENLNCEIC